jgi:hypothetical protein
MRKTAACAALLACGLIAATGTTAFADGEDVDTTVKVKKKGGNATVSWRMDISKADGSRPDSIHQAAVALPKSVHADAKGLKTCPMEALERNDDGACPKGSKVGKAASAIHTPEVRAQPYGATGEIYFTGMKGKNPTFGIYYTLTEIQTLHSVSRMMVTRKGKVTTLRMDQPPVPVPGLPDSTPLFISVSFDKGKPFKMSGSCKKGSKAAAQYGFFANSPASHDNDVFHTSIPQPLKGSAKAC